MRGLLDKMNVLAVALAVITIAVGPGETVAYASSHRPMSVTTAVEQPTENRMFSGGDGSVHRFGHRWKHDRSVCFGLSDTHRRTYLLLLAEKYAPATVPEWKRTFAESDRLRKELRSRIESERKEAAKRPSDKDNQIVPAPPHEERGNRKRDQRHDEHAQKARERWSTVMRTFNEAVSSGKPENIRHALTGLLEQTKQHNEMRKRRLES